MIKIYSEYGCWTKKPAPSIEELNKLLDPDRLQLLAWWNDKRLMLGENKSVEGYDERVEIFIPNSNSVSMSIRRQNDRGNFLLELDNGSPKDLLISGQIVHHNGDALISLDDIMASFDSALRITGITRTHPTYDKDWNEVSTVSASHTLHQEPKSL